MKLKPIQNNTVVHVPTIENAKYLLAILHENGYKWLSGNSLIKDNNWDYYKKNNKLTALGGFIKPEKESWK